MFIEPSSKDICLTWHQRRGKKVLDPLNSTNKKYKLLLQYFDYLSYFAI